MTHIFSFLLVVLAFLTTSHSVSANEIWVDVDTKDYTLSVMQGNKVQLVFNNVSIGRYGTTWSKVTKDDKTPLGKFKIGWINEKSRFHRFFGLDYPSLENAKRALEEKKISYETWYQILDAKIPN